MSACSLVIAKYAKQGSLDQSKLNLTVGKEPSSLVIAFGRVEEKFRWGETAEVGQRFTHKQWL